MSTQSRRTSTQGLPQYERPSYPMNPAAQRALAQLTRTHNLPGLDKNLELAQKYLSDAAVDINDRLTSREIAAKKLKERQESRGQAEDEDGGMGTSLIQEKAEGMTERLDQAIRKIIDAQHSVQSIKTSIEHAADNARLNASTQASTQIPRSSRRQREAPRSTGQDNDGTGGNANDAEDAYPDFTPTDPGGGTQPTPSILQMFQQRIEGDKIRYQNHSLTERYANNNAYRDFRRIVHDARHPDGDVPMPHQSEWFREGVAPPPGVTGHNADADADDDDDIAVSRATVSTKCPLTLREFRKPLTSTKCPHTFESEAIHDMIRQNRGRPIACPVPGCREMLQNKDLHVDAVLIRKIQRIQRAKQMEEEDMDDEDRDERVPHGSQGHAQIIDDFDEIDEDDEDDEVFNAVSKAEPRSTAT